MMTLKIQITIGIIIIIGLIYIVNLIRRRRVELKYALSWLLVGIFVLVVDCFPVLMDRLSEMVGIASPVNMMFFMGFLLSLLIILTLTVALSSAASSVKRLIQTIALQEKRIRELEKKMAEDKDVS